MYNINRFLGLIIIVLVAVPGGESNAVVPKTNFVIFLADDLGIGDVGCFGNTTMRTPGIDSIARKGARLDHHLTAAAVCTPSRAALLTGRYPVRQGMEASGFNKVLLFLATTGGLPPNETTFARLLQRNGYATALIGKWHLGLDCETYNDGCHHPNRHGFDYYYGVPLTNLKDFGEDGDSVVTTYTPRLFPILTAIVLVGITFSIFALRRRSPGLTCLCLVGLILLPGLAGMVALSLKRLNSVLLRNNEVVEQPIRLSGLTQRFVREAKDYVSQQVETSNPFLLVVSFVHVHTALFTAPGFTGKSHHGRYGDNVEELDWAIQQILYHLREEDIADNTFVYFSSDNGGHIEERGVTGEQEGGYNGRFKGGKCMGGMEGGIRVPSAIMWPDRIAEGKVLDVPTSQMDLFPTMLDVAGIALPKDRVIDGKSLLPLLLEEKSLKRSRNSRHHKFLFHYCGTSIHAVRYVDKSGNIWKVHFAAPKWLPGTYRCKYVCQCYDSVTYDPPLVFNLSVDPYEDVPLNITTNPRVSEALAIILKAVDEHKSTVEEVPSQFTFLNSIWRPWLQPCCNFPYCTCTDEAHSQ